MKNKLLKLISAILIATIALPSVAFASEIEETTEITSENSAPEDHSSYHDINIFSAEVAEFETDAAEAEARYMYLGEPSENEILANKAADEIIGQTITSDMNEFEKAFYSYIWLCDNVKYSFFSENNMNFSDILYDNDPSIGFYCSVTRIEIEGKTSEEIYDLYYSGKTYDGVSYPVKNSDDFFNQGYFIKNNAVLKKINPSEFRTQPDEFEMNVFRKYGYIAHQSPFGALVQRCCVCAGISNAYTLFMDKLNIPCSDEVCMLDGMLHQYNKVKIKDNWYDVDATNGFFFPKRNNESDGSWTWEHVDYRIRYREIYGEDMPKRIVNGKEYGGSIDQGNRIDLGNGNYVGVNDCEFKGKKCKPRVTVSYNGTEYFSGKGGKLSVKYKNNKHAGIATVTIKKVKGRENKTISNELKGLSIEFTIHPVTVSSDNIFCKIRNNIIKSVKVRTGGKLKKVPKKMWKQSGDILEFSKDYSGSLSINEIPSFCKT